MSNVQYVPVANYEGHKQPKTGMSTGDVVFHGLMVLLTGGLWLLVVGSSAAWKVGANAGKPKTVVMANVEQPNVTSSPPKPTFGQMAAHEAIVYARKHEG